EEQLELSDGRRLARRHGAESEERPAEQDDGARPESIRERAPDEGPDTHAEKVEERGRRDRRAGPAHGLGDWREEDTERQHPPESHTGDQDANRDDDPTVEEGHRVRLAPRTWRPWRPARACRSPRD